jgi:hypothetical protein
VFVLVTSLKLTVKVLPVVVIGPALATVGVVVVVVVVLPPPLLPAGEATLALACLLCY